MYFGFIIACETAQRNEILKVMKEKKIPVKKPFNQLEEIQPTTAVVKYL